MKRKTREKARCALYGVVGAALCAVPGAGSARAQAPAARPARPSAAVSAAPATGKDSDGVDVPVMEDDSSFIMETDPPLALLQNPMPFPTPPPLFAPYDPLDGLSPQAKTSRVAALTARDIAVPSGQPFRVHEWPSVNFPIMTVKAGQSFSVPVTLVNSPNLSAIRVGVVFDPAVVRFTGAKSLLPDGKNTMIVNDAPDPKATVQNSAIVFSYGLYDWVRPKSAFSLQFTALKAGQSLLVPFVMELTGSEYEIIPSVVRSGQVTVVP